MAVLASLARLVGWGPRCRIVTASAEGPLFARLPMPRRAPPRARRRPVAVER